MFKERWIQNVFSVSVVQCLVFEFVPMVGMENLDLF